MFNMMNSTEDNSVNFVQQDEVGFTEARYVRRCKDRFIIYLSSQTGCNRGCKFCHLTATKQTKFEHVSVEGYNEQASQVMRYYNTMEAPLHMTDKLARVVHYNFMARGEALDNPNLIQNPDLILGSLKDRAVRNKLIPKINISTIMPKSFKGKSLSQIFATQAPTIYYSIYSMNPEFRKKWIPGAMDVELALDKLAEYQEDTKKIIKLHWAFIAGENDHEDDVLDIWQAVRERGLKVEVNVVRYNPYSYSYGEESSILVIEDRMKELRDYGCHVKMIDRVGFDVKASCGMFV